MLKAIDVSAGGAFMATGGAAVGRLGGVTLAAAAANATIIVRETDGSGRKLVALSALAGDSQSFTPPSEIMYQGNVHVTITGAGAQAFVYEG